MPAPAGQRPETCPRARKPGLQPRQRPSEAPEEPSAPPSSASPSRGELPGLARPCPASLVPTPLPVTRPGSLQTATVPAKNRQSGAHRPGHTHPTPALAQGQRRGPKEPPPPPPPPLTGCNPPRGEGTDSPQVRRRRAHTAAHRRPRRRINEAFSSPPPPLSPAVGRRACGLGALTCWQERAAPARHREMGGGGGAR